MKQEKHLIKQEEKPKVMIGILRTYNHENLLAFLQSKGLTVKQFAEGFNYRTRTALLALAPANVVEYALPFENITPTVGFEVITKMLTGNASALEELEVMVHAFGDDNTEPADGDTELGNETSRKLLSSKSFNGASAFYTVFYDLAEGNGTHEEMGLFANADPGVADDGTLWDHSLIEITKTDSQSLSIDYEDSFVNNI